MNLYDGGTVSECNYYAQAGGGIIDVAKEYILIVLVFGYTILSTTLLFVAYTLLRQKDSEMVDAAFHTLHSNFGTALDMCANGDSIFQESSSTFLNFNDSITKLHGATRIFYGYLLDSERYGSVGYGLQHQIEFKQKE